MMRFYGPVLLLLLLPFSWGRLKLLPSRDSNSGILLALTPSSKISQPNALRCGERAVAAECVNSANGKNAKLRHVPENGATLDLGHGQDQGRAVHAYEQSASPIKATILVTFTITLDGKKSQHESISTTLM
uniref:Secreted protein n=1 Tax=Anopheles coluzzii TaxID=1518534 RepID=A0A8W7PIU7_ANOCL